MLLGPPWDCLTPPFCNFVVGVTWLGASHEREWGLVPLDRNNPQCLAHMPFEIKPHTRLVNWAC